MTVSKSQEIEINVVGSSKFGRYKKISDERTYNMFISDEWLVSYAGFKKQVDIKITGKGRGIFNSLRGDFLIVVISADVYRLDSNLAPRKIGSLQSTVGDVYIDENLSEQVCIVDGKTAYIYNYGTVPESFTPQTLLFNSIEIFPSYVCYHNSFFLFGSAPTSPNRQNWYAYEKDTDTTLKFNSQFSIQTKPDNALAVQRLPGRGNSVLVLGGNVAEIWMQIGGLENYRRVQSINIDYGLVSISTLAASDQYICWLGKNESNSAAIMMSDGSGSKRLSTDGIDYILGQLNYPNESCAFFYRQDGHLFYQLTFFNKADNLSIIYDFNTGLFFNVTNESLDYHPAKTVVFYNEETYFISLNDGSLYKMDTNLLTYDYNMSPESVGEEIPRIRICKTARQKNSERFRVGQFTFWIEQGVNNYHKGNPIIPRVDMSFSKNGNQSFSNIVGHTLNAQGNYKNQIKWYRMGQCNEFTVQLRFWGLQRFVCSNGVINVY